MFLRLNLAGALHENARDDLKAVAAIGPPEPVLLVQLKELSLASR